MRKLTMERKRSKSPASGASLSKSSASALTAVNCISDVHVRNACIQPQTLPLKDCSVLPKLPS